ncbi:MAG TPA: acetylornithine deacetylase [Pseudolabrys sp.]|nr:acetylornithine deacetylase [Pseudolabrys sp.]
MSGDRILEILSTLVAFDTTSRNSNLPLIDWAEQHLSSHGFRCERIPDATGRKANLWASIGPADVPGVIFSGHTDVVPVDGQSWSSDPFKLRVDNGRAYARGACDMKGFVAVCLAASEAVKEDKLARPIHLALSYDEEVGCIGARGIVEMLKQAKVKPAACLVGEPTLMRGVIGHKSKRSVRVAVRGKACHSALAPQGVNAVEWGSRLIAEIARIGDRLASEGPRDPLYDVPHSTAHVGIFHGGTALNIVPDAADFVFEVRTVGADDADALVAEVMRYAREQLEPRMQAVDPQAGFAFDIFAGFPGLDTKPDDPLVGLTRSLGVDGELRKVAFGTEAGLYSVIAGVPSIIVGPGSIEQAHKPDEWVEIDQLQQCRGLVDRLMAWCER